MDDIVVYKNYLGSMCRDHTSQVRQVCPFMKTPVPAGCHHIGVNSEWGYKNDWEAGRVDVR